MIKRSLMRAHISRFYSLLLARLCLSWPAKNALASIGDRGCASGIVRAERAERRGERRLFQGATKCLIALMIINASTPLHCAACDAADQSVDYLLARRSHHLEFFPYKWMCVD